MCEALHPGVAFVGNRYVLPFMTHPGPPSLPKAIVWAGNQMRVRIGHFLATTVYPIKTLETNGLRSWVYFL